MVNFIIYKNTLDRPFSFDRDCFLCFNKYRIVGKGWVKCTFVF